MKETPLEKCMVCLLITSVAPACLAEPIELWNTGFFLQSIEVADNEKSFLFADINEDECQDLIVAHSSRDEIVVFLGNADGELRRTRRIPAGEDPSHVTANDIDADGNIDIVVANHETSHLTLLLGNGRGGFDSASNSPFSVDVDPHPHVAHARDLDNDKIVDLLVDHRNGRGLLAVAGLGDGAFDESGVLVYMDGDPYLGMAIGDINNDGLLDLATPNPNEVGIALNTSSGGISFELAQPVGVASPFALAFVDINADSVLDLVVASDGATSAVEVLIGDGQGRFVRLDEPVPMRAGAKSVNIGDFDGDNVGDVLATSWSSDAVVIRGGTVPLEIARVSLGGIENPWGVAVDDINGDGKDDFVIGDGIRPVANIYVSRSKKK